MLSRRRCADIHGGRQGQRRDRNERKLAIWLDPGNSPIPKDLLFLQSYYKGVASEEFIYEPAKKDVADDNREYSIEFKSPFPDKMVYTINWATGRYLQRVYMYQKSRTIPSKEGSGKCAN